MDSHLDYEQVSLSIFIQFLKLLIYSKYRVNELDITIAKTKDSNVYQVTYIMAQKMQAAMIYIGIGSKGHHITILCKYCIDNT